MDPKLIQATLRTITGDEDRDHDTCISVEVRAADQQTMIAQIAGAECAGQYGYGDGETHEFEIGLLPHVVPLTKNRCQGFQWRMGIFPKGHDRWKFDAWLILHFDDGTTLANDKLGQDMDCVFNAGCWDGWG
jgi:hypothetical protein